MEEPESNVRSISRALRILDCFSREYPALSLVEIAKRIELSPSTTSRLVATLENNGYLRRDEKSLEYSLGYKLAHLGAVCLASEGLKDIAHPYLEALRNLFNESAGLYVLSKNHRVCIDCVPSTQAIHRVIEVGERLDMTMGASGRLLLAYQPPEFIQHYMIENPLVNISVLADIREAGYAISRDERTVGITSIAAPVFDAQRHVKAALFISGPSFRIGEDIVSKMVVQLKQSAHDISLKLGY